MVIRLRAFAFGRAHQFAVVTQKDEQRVVRPRAFEGFRHEVPDGPVGIFHDLFFRCPAARMEVGRDDVRRMVADGEQDAEKRLSALGLPVEHGQGVLEQEVVLYAESVDHLVRRVIFLRINVVETVGTEKGVHVVVLRFVRHEEHVMVAVFFQYGGQAGVDRNDGAFHGVALHHGRERIERGIHAMVGVDAG